MGRAATMPKCGSRTAKKAKKKAVQPRAMPTGVIRADETYTIDAFCREVGVTRGRLSDMRRRGLKIREDGKYRIILGRDYLDWIAARPFNTAFEPAIEDK